MKADKRKGESRPNAPGVEETMRIVPPGSEIDLARYLLYRRHLFAYEQAVRCVGEAQVCVDLACGHGYGLEVLGRCAHHVIAMDLAHSPLRALPRECNRLQADAAQLPLDDDSVDLVVGFQLIEHVTPTAAKHVVAEIRRVLRPGGVGFLTTPNARWRLRMGQAPWNPFHAIEYFPDQMRALCEEMGIARDGLFGIVGCDDAQRIEQGRVRWPRRRQVLRWLHHQLTWCGNAPVRSADRDRQWFILHSDYTQGLDYWIEVRP